jgi:hypothetical protein
VLKKNGNTMRLEDLKKAYDSVRREAVYNILIEFGASMKLLMLIKMSLNETCSKVLIGKHLCDIFPIQNELKEGNVLSLYGHCFSTLL